MPKKIAIVTGANKGLGLALVKGLCEIYGGTVYLTSRDEERGMKSCEELKAIGLRPVYHQLDVTNGESVAKFIDNIRNKGEEVDILINNAGILFLKDAEETKLYQTEQTIAVNFSALVNFTEAVIPLMGNGGKIVNISSSSGHLSRIPSEELREKIKADNLNLDELKSLMNYYIEAVKKNAESVEGWGDSPYVVSKVGVNAYTFMLHRRLSSKGILVNSVHPGYVMSDMTRGAGSVTPAEAAEIPLRLALHTDRGGLYYWHNGIVVPWDGPDPRSFIDGKV